MVMDRILRDEGVIVIGIIIGNWVELEREFGRVLSLDRRRKRNMGCWRMIVTRVVS